MIFIFRVLSFSREGVRLVPGGRFGKGRIIMTKNIDEQEFDSFMEELIGRIRFPGTLSIDGHGFIQTKTGEPIYIF